MVNGSAPAPHPSPKHPVRSPIPVKPQRTPGDKDEETPSPIGLFPSANDSLLCTPPRASITFASNFAKANIRMQHLGEGIMRLGIEGSKPNESASISRAVCNSNESLVSKIEELLLINKSLQEQLQMKSACDECASLARQLDEYRRREVEWRQSDSVKDETILRLRDENGRLRIDLRAHADGRISPPLGFLPVARTSPSPMNVSPISELLIPPTNLRQGDDWLLPEASQILLGLGWSSNHDLDASAIMLSADCRYYDHVYFGKSTSKDGSVIHNTTQSDGDKSIISIDFDRITNSVVYVFIIVTMHTQCKTIGEVAESYCRLLSGDPAVPIAHFDVMQNGGENTAQILVCLHRDTQLLGRWRVSALGEYCNGRSWNDVEPKCRVIATTLTGGGPDSWAKLMGWLRVQQKKDKLTFLSQTSYLQSWDDELAIPHHVSSVRMGLKWSSYKNNCDLDASIIALDRCGKHIDHVYFGKRTSADGAIVHRGDNLTGGDGGDNETIDINLNLVSIKTVFMFCVVTLYTGGDHLHQVRDAHVRLFDSTQIEATGGSPISTVPFAQFDLQRPSSLSTGQVFVCMYRDPLRLGCWKLLAIGDSVEVNLYCFHIL